MVSAATFELAAFTVLACARNASAHVSSHADIDHIRTAIVTACLQMATRRFSFFVMGLGETRRERSAHVSAYGNGLRRVEVASCPAPVADREKLQCIQRVIDCGTCIALRCAEFVATGTAEPAPLIARNDRTHGSSRQQHYPCLKRYGAQR